MEKVFIHWGIEEYKIHKADQVINYLEETFKKEDPDNFEKWCDLLKTTEFFEPKTLEEINKYLDFFKEICDKSSGGGMYRYVIIDPKEYPYFDNKIFKNQLLDDIGISSQEYAEIDINKEVIVFRYQDKDEVITTDLEGLEDTLKKLGYVLEETGEWDKDFLYDSPEHKLSFKDFLVQLKEEVAEEKWRFVSNYLDMDSQGTFYADLFEEPISYIEKD